MRIKTQVMTADGFDRSVAEKMPKMKKMEEPLPQEQEDFPFPQENPPETMQNISPFEKPAEKRMASEPPPKAGTALGQEMDVLRLVDDLHTQLLVSSRTKKALEMDLASHQKTIHQLAQDNKGLRMELEAVRQELQRFREAHAETIYLKEENEEALQKIRDIQQELKGMRENLTRVLKERDEAFDRIRELELQVDQSELAKVKGRMNEREISHFQEENLELRSRLEEALSQHAEMERKYEALKRSFNEIKESLTLLRDSYKRNYYNLSGCSDDASVE